MDYPNINGVRHEWSSVEIKLGEQIYLGVAEVKYSDTLKGTKLYGTHPQAIGRTRGQYECEASIVMYLEEADHFREALGDGYKEVPFDIVVSYTEDEKTIVDEIIGAKITKDEGGGAKGADGLTCPWELDPMFILWNGKNSLKRPLEAVRTTAQ